MPFAGNAITLYDFSKPIKERHKGPCSPYQWRVPQPTDKQDSRGFYLGNTRFKPVVGDASFRLRLEWANEMLPHSALARINGYFIDSHQEETYTPIIARLNHNRGFLAGWTMGSGMLSAIDYSTRFALAEDAARYAHSMAEIDAEREREYREREDEKERAEEATSDDALRALAQAEWAGDDVNVEDDAKVSRGDDGAWVQAWVWVATSSDDE